jgi:hypothetical protein
MGRKKKQLSGQLIFDDSVKRLWAIRRYGTYCMYVVEVVVVRL